MIIATINGITINIPNCINHPSNQLGATNILSNSPNNFIFDFVI
ncbi:hypothetical protein [Methanobrevibacter arboriphilus]|nr:hypothetical protein [Methanobrevibacter arboriphilus]